MRNSGSNVGPGSGLFAPMDFGGPGMFNPTPMASQGQPGMQPTPAAQVANRFGGMQPPSPMPDPAQQVAARFPQTMAQAPAPAQAPQAPSVPVPSPRPAQAPQPQPQMGFFQRNAAMMRDPATGELIDPQGAARAQASMPSHGTGTWGSKGILPSVMNLIGAGTGAPGTNANGSIQGAYGPTSVGGAPLQQAPQQQDQGGLIQRMLGYLGSKQS
jgi:hypothetical protein